MAERVLELVPIYLGDRRSLIPRLAPELEGTFGFPVRMRQVWFDPERAYDPSRGQYDSTLLLRMLLDDPGPAPFRIVGVAGVDLFTPVLTYVFGEAQLDGRAAVVSLHRLRPEAYGLPLDEELVHRRLVIEATHELGHTWGLLHCAERSCAMHASTYVEEIDLKTAELCPRCLARVRGAASADVASEPAARRSSASGG